MLEGSSPAALDRTEVYSLWQREGRTYDGCLGIEQVIGLPVLRSVPAAPGTPETAASSPMERHLCSAYRAADIALNVWAAVVSGHFPKEHSPEAS